MILLQYQYARYVSYFNVKPHMIKTTHVWLKFYQAK